MAGFLAPLFWLGLGSADVYVAPTESNLCATIAIYSALAATVATSPALDATILLGPALTGDIEIGTC